MLRVFPFFKVPKANGWTFQPECVAHNNPPFQLQRPLCVMRLAFAAM